VCSAYGERGGELLGGGTSSIFYSDLSIEEGVRRLRHLAESARVQQVDGSANAPQKGRGGWLRCSFQPQGDGPVARFDFGDGRASEGFHAVGPTRRYFDQADGPQRATWGAGRSNRLGKGLQVVLSELTAR